MTSSLLAITFVLACFTGCSSTQRRYIDPTTAISHHGVSVLCETRYYVVAPPPDQMPPLLGYPKLRVWTDDRKRIRCSVPEPWGLLERPDTHRMLDVRGFVLEIIRPSEYAGRLLTAHFDGMGGSGDPFKAFAPDKRYVAEVSPGFIGDTRFKLCY